MASIGVIVIAFVIAGVALLRRRRRVVAAIRLDVSDRNRARRLARQLGFWADALRIMERRGLKKAPSETPLAYSRRAAAADPEVGASLAYLVELMYRIRFGGYDPQQEELERAEATVRSIRAGARAS